MSAKDNVFSSYSFGEVFIEDAPTLPVTAPVVYWDETDSDAETCESVRRPQIRNAQAGLRCLLSCNQVYRQRLPHGMVGRLAA